MKLSLFFISLLATTVLAQIKSGAPIVENNAPSATYQALLQTSKPIHGSITGASGVNGTGVGINVDFFDFPDASSSGPFAYHLHQLPVPSDGNCTATGGHLDPYLHGESPACDPNDASNCQVGDLSGKHGTVTPASAAPGSSFQLTYVDLYLSTRPDSAAFFGNRSVVVHAHNGTRLNCGNFVKADSPSYNNGGGGGGGSNNTSSSSPSSGSSSSSNHTLLSTPATNATSIVTGSLPPSITNTSITNAAAITSTSTTVVSASGNPSATATATTSSNGGGGASSLGTRHPDNAVFGLGIAVAVAVAVFVRH